MNPGKELFRADVETTPASWVSEVAQRPIAFAQVREDPALDQWVIEQLPPGAEVLMVASGGCTAAALAATPTLSRLHLIDPNPAQIALCRLKLRLLETSAPTERLALLGHAPMPSAERSLRLAAELESLDLPMQALGPMELIASVGPDHAGRYEALFSKLREALGQAAEEIATLLQLKDPAEQSRRADPITPLGRALDAAFDSAMALPNLVALFGEGATRNRCEPFSKHFARRTRHVLGSLPAADNPYLWQMLLGHFPRHVIYPWLAAPAPARMPEVFWSVGDMTQALQGRREVFDFIHLSNILDWLAPEEARSILDLAWSALRPGGWTLIRQLNSILDVQAAGGRFGWQNSSSDALHRCDRSFFYRRLHLGRKQ
jgi:S-adenosylmethionine-diacylglycerol 3-amino-3-carboxypropyl transferase